MPLFGKTSPQAQAMVAARLQPTRYEPGDTICREDEPADRFFLVETGTLSVSGEFGGRTRELARMGPGQFFGEIALLGSGRRTATVTAVTEVVLWGLSSEDFAQLLTTVPELAEVIRTVAKDRAERFETSSYEVRRRNLAELLEGHQQLRVGRDPSNDIVIDAPLVAPFHALIERDPQGYRLKDLQSSSGTFVNGAAVSEVLLKDGDELWLGHVRFVFEGSALAQVSQPRGLRIDARGLSKDVKGGKRILHDISLSILPGELVALVGGSGAGKSTLLDALSGVRAATSGEVLYDGQDYYSNLAFYRQRLGYVPQDDIIHTDLALRRTLLHAARLRMPAGTSKTDREERVDSALEQLGLTGQAEVKVSAVSGGQRKRCSIGVELLTQPGVFFLDEPTSGLDPATDAQMMRLLRRLADEGDTVLVTTHATKNVTLCDKVVFLARGGHVAFIGPPAGALEYFGTESFDEIYERLADLDTPELWAERFRESPEAERVRQQQLARSSGSDEAPTKSSGPLRGLYKAWHQYRVLSLREADINLHSKTVLPPLIAQPIIMTLLLLALFPSGVFDDTKNLNRPLQLILLLVFTSFIVGLLSSVLSIVKEAPIFLRERLVGVGVTPYLLAKATFLGPAVVIRAAFMIGALRLTNRLPDAPWSFYWPLFVTTLLIGLAAMSTGLMTSALSRTSQQATDFLAIWIMPQVLFSGTLFAVPTMGVIGRWIADVTATRFAFESAANDSHMLSLFKNAGTPAGLSLYDQYHSSFDLDRMSHWLVLGAFVLVPLLVARVVLGRRKVR